MPESTMNQTANECQNRRSYDGGGMLLASPSPHGPTPARLIQWICTESKGQITVAELPGCPAVGDRSLAGIYPACFLGLVLTL